MRNQEKLSRRSRYGSTDAPAPRPKGIVSKREDSRYVSGRSPYWLKMKNPAREAARREAEEEWGH